MSADPDDPGHFVRWANARGIPAESRDFLSRRDYGRYLRDVFAEAATAHPGRLRVLRARATALHPDAGGCLITLSPPADPTALSAVVDVPAADKAPGDVAPTTAGHRPAARGTGAGSGVPGRIRVDHVVLATGSPAGSPPAAVAAETREHPGYVADPWRPGALDAIPADAPVLLIGAGLTAVDVALSLTAGGTRRAPITAVSRRGQLPLSHTVAHSPPAAPALDDCATLREVVRAVRASAAEAGDWRAVVDGLRPHLDELWVALTAAEQEAFLRHLARTWECHRHRMAPSVAARIADLRSTGALRVRSGGVRSVTHAPDGGLMVEFGPAVGLAETAEVGPGGAVDVQPGGDGDGRDRGSAGPRRFAAVVNCSGPGRLPGAAGPLVGGLLAAGLVRIGPHGLGLDIDAAGRLVAADGGVHRRLWLVGPLRRGARWETTAVPEIRAQAHRLATDIAAAVAGMSLPNAA
jgi:uncharacterized NAD(P)/FAD-binding protein YdhS